MQTHPLLPKLKALRLGGMIHTLEQRSRESLERSLAPLEFLALLLDDEIERRDQSRLRRRIDSARLDDNKSLAKFDFSVAVTVQRSLINELCSCRFVAKGENVLLAGPTGTGKSHLAQALGHEAIKRGYRVLYRPLHKLLAQLHGRRADGSFEKMYRRLLNVDLLMLDDFGLIPLSEQAAEDLYEIIRKRYENKSIVVTSNRAPDEWSDVFGNSLMASAALDRLTHHSYFIEIKGESYRQRQRKLRTGNSIFKRKENKNATKSLSKLNNQSLNKQIKKEEKGGDL